MDRVHEGIHGPGPQGYVHFGIIRFPSVLCLFKIASKGEIPANGPRSPELCLRSQAAVIRV